MNGRTSVSSCGYHELQCLQHKPKATFSKASLTSPLQWIYPCSGLKTWSWLLGIPVLFPWLQICVYCG